MNFVMTYYVNRWNDHGIRHVMDAIERDDIKWLKRLVEYNATVHHTYANKYTQRIEWSERKYSHLFSLSTDVWTRPLYLEPPISLAVRLDKIAIVEYLLSKGIDPNAIQANGNTLLHLAVINRNYDMVRILLNHRANPNLPNLRGQTAIWEVIADDDHYELVKILLNSKALIAYKDIDGQTLLHKMAGYSDNYQSLPMLLEQGCQINAVDNNGYTPLYYAIFHKQKNSKLEQISELLKQGADPTILTRSKESAFMMAKTRDLKDISELFDNWIIENLLD